MNKYVFLRINEKFKMFFKGNLDAFVELYNRREESVFYKEQFRLFLEKNKKEYYLRIVIDKEEDSIKKNKQEDFKINILEILSLSLTQILLKYTLLLLRQANIT